MNDARTKKMNAMLKEIVSTALLEATLEVQSDFWLITVNSVRIAPDMSYLDIFVSSIKNKEILCKTLAPNAQFIKESINKAVTLRKTPIVRFRYDDEMEVSTHLMGKINQLEIKDL